MYSGMHDERVICMDSSLLPLHGGYLRDRCLGINRVT